MPEAHLERLNLQLGELARRVEPGHGQVIARRAQVLADGQDVAVHGSEIAEDREQFVCFFAQAGHHPGLGNSGGVELLGKLQQLQRALISRAGPYDSIEPRHGFRVVVKDFGPGFDNNADGLLVALKVGDEYLGATAGRLAANLVDHHGEGARSADEIVVAIHAGDNRVLQAECGHGFSHAARLVKVDGLWPAFGYSAESAPARAQVAQHHEGRGFVVPALADIGAMRALAYGVQAKRSRQALQVMVVFTHRGAGFEPLRLWSGSGARRRNLDEFHNPLIVPAEDTQVLLAQPLSHLRPHQVEEEDQVQQPLHQRRSLVLAGENPQVVNHQQHYRGQRQRPCPAKQHQ